jgi:4-amino-4-deoxy-L-arabinose transferase-like glycosyltransferase
VAVFGLNEFAERFPAAFMGVLTVYLTYLLCRKLFERDGEAVGLIAALFLAVSPWHTHINRFGHDVNTMPFFFVLDYTRS